MLASTGKHFSRMRLLVLVSSFILPCTIESVVAPASIESLDDSKVRTLALPSLRTCLRMESLSSTLRPLVIFDGIGDVTLATLFIMFRLFFLG